MKVSEYYGMPIYSDRGRYVGEVQDVVLDFDRGTILGLGFGQSEGKITTVPYENVMAIGEIVIVRSKEIETQPVPEGESEN